MPQAIGALLVSHNGAAAIPAKRRDKRIGTPGMANRIVGYRAEDREEQVNSDRLPPRRGENLAIAARCAELEPRRVAVQAERMAGSGVLPTERFKGLSPVRGTWQALDQAIRAVDLLLQSGGFSMIVMDMGSTPAEFAWRIPLATWFRFRAACERARVTLLLLTQYPCARSSAELVVRMETGRMEADGRVMSGVRYRAEMERQRFAEKVTNVVPSRKPPQAERPGQWRSEVAWV
jgi:recombination protein RecA